MTVLFVEDYAADADLVRLCIERYAPDIELDIVPTMAEARQRLDAYAEAWLSERSRGDASAPSGTPTVPRYELVLTDLNLPDGNGLSLLAHIRSQTLPLAVVILTGTGSEESVLGALRAGADDYVAKSPDHQAALPNTLRAALEQYRQTAHRRSRTLRVLYAEPNSHDVDLTARELGRSAPHLEIQIVVSAEEVLAHFANAGSQPDVLLLDYRLPGMNAIDLVKELRQARQLDAPIVLVTGHGDEEIAREAMKLGASDYLVKVNGYLQRLPTAIESAFYRAEAARERLALQRREREFRTLAENLPDIVIRCDRAGAIRYMNPAAAALAKRSPLECAGCSLIDVCLPSGMSEVWGRGVTEALASGVGRSCESRCPREGGGARTFDAQFVPERDAGGEIESVLVIARDLTERLQMEERFRQSQKMEAIGQLSGGVAHDFNNLLTIIQGHLGLLNTDDEVPPSIAAPLREITDAVERASNLTRQLLTFSRKSAVETRVLDLRCLIADVHNMLARIVGESVSLDVSLPTEPVWVSADAGMIEQVLLNFAVNARDAMPDGGRLQIALQEVGADEITRSAPHEQRPEGRCVRLSVSDTGVGIAPEVLPQIFDPFFTTKGPGKGTGLGLATVYGIARQHKGWLDVESAPGCGATFHFYLPTSQPPEPAIASPERSSVPDQDQDGVTVLLVEDEPAVGELAKTILERQGHRVYSAETGEEALALWAEHSDEIGLLMVDMILPDKTTGSELAHTMLQTNPNLKVLYTSGYESSFLKTEVALEEGTNFLQKPYSIRHFTETVRRCLQAPVAVR